MRRAKLGDVYAIKVMNRYKLIQWAYEIPHWGKYIRVFDGLYDTIPENVQEIVRGEHSYIVGFHISRAYRIGLAQFIENIPVPDKYPLPQYRLSFWGRQLNNNFGVWVRPTPAHPSEHVNTIYSFDVSSLQDLPDEFRNLKLLDAEVTPALLMFWFYYDFNLNHIERYWPKDVLGESEDAVMSGYCNRVDALLEADRLKRKNARYKTADDSPS